MQLLLVLAVLGIIVGLVATGRREQKKRRKLIRLRNVEDETAAPELSS